MACVPLMGRAPIGCGTCSPLLNLIMVCLPQALCVPVPIIRIAWGWNSLLWHKDGLMCREGLMNEWISTWQDCYEKYVRQ